MHRLSIFLITLILWAQTACNSSQENISLKKSILDNPLTALEKAHATKNAFIKKVFFNGVARKESINTHDMLNDIQNFEQECPFFLLDECSEPQHCYLSRSFDESFRTTFEDTVSKSLIQAMQARSNKQGHYLVFASGYLFQDLIILSKTLAQIPDATLTIHLIDTEYAPSLEECTYENHFDEAITTYYVPILKALFKQFTTTLQTMFPQATILLYVYGDHESYLYTTKKKLYHYPDVVTAADLPSSHRVTTDYHTVLRTVLQNNPDSKNFSLNAINILPFNSNKENDKLGAHAAIESYSLQPLMYMLKKESVLIATKHAKNR